MPHFAQINENNEVVQVLVVRQEYINTGFIALQDLPSYYQNLLYIAISSSFGMKAGQSAFKMFKKK